MFADQLGVAQVCTPSAFEQVALQLVAPLADVVLPSWHAVQALAPAALYDPSTHSVPADTPAAQNDPAGHVVEPPVVLRPDTVPPL